MTLRKITGDRPKPEGDNPAKTKFVPTWLDDIDVDKEPAYVVDGIIPAGPSFGEIVGLPKSLKSFFLTDLLMHIAMGKPYNECGLEAGLVVYITSEGIQGAKRRLVAMRRHHGVEGMKIPFALISVMPNLGTDATDLNELILVIKQALESRAAIKPDIKVCAVVIDTLRKATPNKSEYDPKDMSVFLANCEKLAQDFSCFVGVVHHSPRGEQNRGSGTNAVDGACDVIISVERLAGTSLPSSRVTVSRMKDGEEEGLSWQIEVHSVEVGVDRKGKPKIGAYVVVTAPPEKHTAPAKSKSPATEIAYLALTKAITEKGEVPLLLASVPPHTKTVNFFIWKTYADALGISAAAKDDSKTRA
jgi:hypothetical protein